MGITIQKREQSFGAALLRLNIKSGGDHLKKNLKKNRLLENYYKLSERTENTAEEIPVHFSCGISSFFAFS